MNKSYLAGLAVVAAAVVIAGFYLFSSGQFAAFAVLQPSSQGNSVSTGADVTAAPPQKELTEFEKLEASVSREKLLEERRRPHRDSYGIPAEVFADLPPIPKDFGTMAYMFETGKWTDLKYFTEAYYLQPEFYPGFETSGLNGWLHPTPQGWGVIGWGAYPADIWANTFQGAEFEARTFWHVGWEVQTYQGFNMVPTYPVSSKDENGTEFNHQDPEVVSKYFDVSFDNPVFILGPAYPKFSRNWAKVLKVTVKVHENAPKGTYVIGIDPVGVPEEIRTEWLNEYRILYFDAASSGISIDRPHFRLIITVN